MEWIRKRWQIIYAVFLIILVPVLIVVNTLLAVNSFRKNTDIALQRQALVIGRMFNVAAQDKSVADAGAMQTLIEDIADEIGDDVYAMDVLVPSGDALQSESFTITASLASDAIGRSTSGVQHVLAWTQDEAFAFLTNDPTLSSAPVELAERVRSGRYWTVILPLHDDGGKRVGLLFMKLSLSTIDAIVSDALLRSYIFLAVTVLITVLILASNTRLFQYAVLFKKLKEVDKMKDEFISVASHELKAPIAALKGFISLFLDNAFGPFKGVARDKMQVLMLLSDRLGNLVEDLLNVSRIEQGRLAMKQVPTQPEDVIKLIMEEFESNAVEKKLAFTFKKPAALMPKIFVDPDRLKQVLANIISNAIKYTPQGSVTITTFTEDDNVKIKCTDTGLGMSPEARERLFTKFYRIQTDDTREIPGTGLGLWITKQIVEMQDGHIYVDSIEKVGTQTTVMFPAMSEEAVKKAEAKEKTEDEKSQPPTPPPKPKV